MLPDSEGEYPQVLKAIAEASGIPFGQICNFAIAVQYHHEDGSHGMSVLSPADNSEHIVADMFAKAGFQLLQGTAEHN